MEVKKVAIVTCMAAMYAALSFLPGFPVIGGGGAQIGIVSSIVPLYGFLLGPWLGTLAALFGVIITRTLKAAGPFVWLNSPAIPLSPFIAGALSRPRLGSVKGWVVSAVTLAILVAAWYVTPVGREVPYFPVLQWVGLAIILIFRSRLSDLFYSKEKKKLTLSVALCSYAATVTTHMYGNLAFLAAVELVLLKVSNLPSFFAYLVPVVVIERLILTAISTIIGVPTILALEAQIPRLTKRRSSMS